MTFSGYEDYVLYSRQHFEEGLIRAGFVERESGWHGPIEHSGQRTEVILSLPARFPFHPPRVVPTAKDSTPWSWHRELDGALCLVAEDDHDNLWWVEAAAFLEHVTDWFVNSDAGWPGDRPDLDLERYFRRSQDERLYIFDDLEARRDSFVRFRPSANNTMLIGSGTRPPKASKHNNARFGYVADLGEVDVPPRDWGDISAQVRADVNLDHRIRTHLVEIVVLLYRRGAHGGAIVLEVWPTKGGGIEARWLKAAADTDAARFSRAGSAAPLLREVRVAIIGVGALGSFVADMLVRAGVRNLTLVDDDIVKPGNLIRHLVGPQAVGLAKVTAVQQSLAARHQIPTAGITIQEDTVTSGDVAMELLMSHDLVINTSADFSTTALLHVMARSTGQHLVSAVIQNGGATYRVDILPPLNDVPSLTDTIATPHESSRDVFEAGCGSPISPTPPHVAIEAAATTVRHAIGILVANPVHSAGELRDFTDIARASQ